MKPFPRHNRLHCALSAVMFMALGLVLLWPRPMSAAALPNLGDGQDMGISAEKKLGQRIAGELYRDPDYIDDPLITDYLQRLWQPLLDAARRRGDISPEQESLAWSLMTGKDRSINAFALPGGYFGVHLGLVGAVSSGDELASVLAHEITHVSQRHIARNISRHNAQTPWLIGAMILGALAASKNPDIGNATIAGSQAVGAQRQLNFSRDMEREADRIGFAIVQEAGMDVRGFAAMFDKLQQASRLNDNGQLPYLRSHPLTTERLADMQSRLQFVPAQTAAATPIGAAAEHALIATRARLLSDSSADALRTELIQASAALRSTLAASASTAQHIRLLAQLYGGMIASQRLGSAQDSLLYAAAARARLAQVSALPSASLEYARAAIEWSVIETWANTPQASQAVYQAAQTALGVLQAMPRVSQQRSTLLAQAQMALVDTLQRNTGMEALQSALTRQPNDALMWAALAQLHEAQGQVLRSLRAAAEARVGLLDYGGALDRLRAAQDWGRKNDANHIDASIIDTRARAVQAMQQELQDTRDQP